MFKVSLFGKKTIYLYLIIHFLLLTREILDHNHQNTK